MIAATKNVVVVGGSYVGMRAVESIASRLSATHKTVLIEKNSHFQHLFAFPRMTAIPSFEHKAFIPYNDVFKSTTPPNSTTVLRGNVAKILPNRVVLDDGKTVPFEFLVLATGLGPMGDFATAAKEKQSGVAYFQEQQELVAKAEHITIIGGGAYGVQAALDLKDHFPTKQVTVIHSRDHLLNRFHPKLHDIVMGKLKASGIQVILRQRVSIPENGFPTGSAFRIPLTNGEVLQTNLAIVCTGPRSSSNKPLLSTLLPEFNGSDIPVKPTMQVDFAGLENIFAVGDVAATSAAKAARPGYLQASIVAQNIARIIESGDKNTKNLEEFHPDPPAIHLSLGLHESVIFRNPPSADGEPMVKPSDGGSLDVGCEKRWAQWAPDMDRML
ncbi:FAD/NAD-P-binding domain-containing protein [Mycena floridula]|nr:FAD/NAD-P-binding domain-containing protein [Mycena floridula]